MRGFVARRNSLPSIKNGLLALAGSCAAGLVLYGATSHAQVFTVGPESIPRQYLDFHPTNIPLPDKPLTSATHQQLIRLLDAEQGFSVRPLVRGHRGFVLQANGTAKPAGNEYARALRDEGISVDAGQRVVITDLTVEKDRIVFELNGGPDRKHRFLRHVQVGVGGATTAPVSQDDGQEPVGSRITLVFDKFVPAVTGEQVEQLLSPLIDFAVKSPAQAYTDTLPPKLKATILAHHVLVGMDRQMVIAALGPPPRKSREQVGDLPFEEWIYGEPPQEVQFIRVNGNRVIRVEIAKAGQPLEIRAENEMGDYWTTASDTNVHEVRLGDAPIRSDPDRVAPTAPSLRMPGDTPHASAGQSQPDDGSGGNHNAEDVTMKPVHFPKPDPEPVTSVPHPAQTGDSNAAPQAEATTPAPSTTAPAPGNTPQ